MSTLAELVAAAPSIRECVKTHRRLQNSPQGPRAEITYWVKLGELGAALEVIDGLPQTFTTGGTTITRVVPLQYPLSSPSGTFTRSGAVYQSLYAESYDIDEHPSFETVDANRRETGPQAKVTVHFIQRPWPYIGDEPFMQISASGFDDAVPVSGGTFSGGATPGFDVYRPVSGVQYTAQVFDAPNVTPTIEAFWATNSGSVNSTAWRGHAAGYVQYKFGGLNYVLKKNGQRTCNYSLIFMAAPKKWNDEYKRDGSLAELSLSGGVLRHPSLDFATLFV